MFSVHECQTGRFESFYPWWFRVSAFKQKLQSKLLEALGFHAHS